MAEQDVLDKLDDVLGKIEDTLEKIGEVETKVNADSNYYHVCAHCSSAPGGPGNCIECGGTGLRLHGKIQKVEE